MTADPLPDVTPTPARVGTRCTECGRILDGIAAVVDHYSFRHPRNRSATKDD